MLFQGKNFSGSDVSMTAIAIEGYAVGLLGLISIKILAPALYSRKDIKTPVKGAIASLIVVQWLQHCYRAGFRACWIGAVRGPRLRL